MEVYGYLAILATSVFVTLAQILLKKNALNMDSSIGFKGYLELLRRSDLWWAALFTALAPASYIIALWYLPLNKAFVFTSINLLTVPLAALLYFKERISIRRWVGIVLVLAGVLMYAW